MKKTIMFAILATTIFASYAQATVKVVSQDTYIVNNDGCIKR